LAWLEQAKLLDAAQATVIRANSFPGELDEVAAQARALREWFRGFVCSQMGRPLTGKALNLLEPLNRVLERDEGYGAIVARSARSRNNGAPSGLEWRRLRRWSTPNALLLSVAEAMAHLVCTEDLHAFISRPDARTRPALVQHDGLRQPRQAGCPSPTLRRKIQILTATQKSYRLGALFTPPQTRTTILPLA